MSKTWGSRWQRPGWPQEGKDLRILNLRTRKRERHRAPVTKPAGTEQNSVGRKAGAMA